MGNRLRGDDGFGPRVIDLLSHRPLPDNVVLRDLGTAGLTVASDLGEYDLAIFLDVMKEGGEPGTLYKREVRVKEIDAWEVKELASLSLHEAGLEGLLKLAKALGTLPSRVLLIGCEPKSLEPGLDLSKEVEGATVEAASLVLKILGLDDERSPPRGKKR